MQTKLLKQNLAIIIVTVLVTLLFYSAINVVRNQNVSLNQIDKSAAQAACNSSFFTINNPSGLTFTKGCLLDNTKIYSTDSRFFFFQPSTAVNNAAFVQTSNSDIKDSASLSWSITLNTAANIYIMPRHIPGFSAPTWITSNYTRQTNDDLSQITQFMKRKNDQGLIGLYDIFTRTVPAGTVTLSGASDAQHPAYSMYVVALVPTGAVGSPTTTPKTSATPGPSGSTPPANLVAIAQQHVHPPTDCWTIYHHATDGWHLYNLSDYYSVTIGTKVVKQHPGGDDDLTWACGKDMTEVFNKGAKTMGVSGHGDKVHITKSSAMNKLKTLQVPGF